MNGGAEVFTRLITPMAKRSVKINNPTVKRMTLSRSSVVAMIRGVSCPLAICMATSREPKVKTMKAVALLLAIFRSKPSPFCILDEVDAALDEANIGRFTTVLREFLDRSQFIIVTHSKRTMAVCDVLYGITMQESGISKRVGVRFEDWPNEEAVPA